MMFEETPVVVLSHNRLSPLLNLLDRLPDLQGVGMVYVFDNASTYEPLLYELASAQTGFEDTDMNPDIRDRLIVERSLENLGHNGLTPWLEKTFGKTQRFILTDPDVLPAPDCPADLIARLHTLLNRHPQLQKAGPGLVVNDIPDHYPGKLEVQRHERQLLGPFLPDGSRIAAIDTTFALYRNVEAYGSWKAPAARMSEPYMFRHPDWYVDPERLDPEYREYLKLCGPSASYATMLKNWMDARGIKWRD